MSCFTTPFGRLLYAGEVRLKDGGTYERCDGETITLKQVPLPKGGSWFEGVEDNIYYNHFGESMLLGSEEPFYLIGEKK